MSASTVNQKHIEHVKKVLKQGGLKPTQFKIDAQQKGGGKLDLRVVIKAKERPLADFHDALSINSKTVNVVLAHAA